MIKLKLEMKSKRFVQAEFVDVMQVCSVCELWFCLVSSIHTQTDAPAQTNNAPQQQTPPVESDTGKTFYPNSYPTPKRLSPSPPHPTLLLPVTTPSHNICPHPILIPTPVISVAPTVSAFIVVQKHSNLP